MEIPEEARPDMDRLMDLAQDLSEVSMAVMFKQHGGHFVRGVTQCPGGCHASAVFVIAGEMPQDCIDSIDDFIKRVIQDFAPQAVMKE